VFDGNFMLKIDYITECKYELVTVGNFDYKRKSDGTWTTTYADIEKEVDDEIETELEQAYQEFNQKGK